MRASDIARVILIVLVFGILYAVNILAVGIERIKQNWPLYRCNPMIMPFASYFGKDTEQNFSQCVGKLQSALAGVGFVLIGKQAISAAASFNDLQNRLKLLTKQYGEYEQAQKIAAKAAKTFGLSTREATEGITDIFARLRPLGVSLSDIESTFIGFNTVAKLSGASTVAASAAFTQLAQALGSGRLQGDEFRSISEQVPGILVAISAETGIAAGNLKKYASEGKLTSDIVIRALKRIESEGASSIAQIVEDSDIQKFKDFQNAVDSLQVAIGQGLLPVVTPLVNGATDLIKQFAALPKPVQDSVIAVTGLTGAIIILNPLIVTTSGLLSAMAGPAVLGAAITGLSVMGEKALAAAAGKQVLAASITAANTKITAMTVAVGALNLALKAIPFAIVLGGLAAFIGQLQETKRVQKEVNDLINEGTVDQLNAALATNQRTLAEIEFQRTVLQATPGALGGMAAGAFDVLDKATGRTKALSDSIKILQGQLAEGMIGGGGLPEDQPESIKPPSTKPDDTTDKIKNQAEATGRLNLDAISYLETLEETEKIQFEAGRQIAEQLNLHDKLTQEAERRAEAERIAAEAADPGNKMREDLEELLKLENQVAAGATAIGNSFSNAFTSIIQGTKSADQAIADMLSSVAEHFMNMAAQIIAKQLAIIAYGLIAKALGVPGLGGGTSFAGDGGGFGISPSSLATGSPSSFGGGNLFNFAEGGYVSGPTRALIGEGGEPEYIIPESKMRESMSRYSRGARGGSVIPENGGGSNVMDGGGGTAVAAPIDVRYTVERINSVDYVTADQFQQGLQQAANQGAKQGEQQTLKRLQMSSSTRKRIGM